LKTLGLLMMLSISIFCCSSAALQAPESELQGAVSVPVLGFHNIEDVPVSPSGSTITLKRFCMDLDALENTGYTAIQFKDLENWVHRRTALPAKPILITFDDGYVSNYVMAYPELKRRGMKASISVIGWSVGQSFNSKGKPIIPHFSWDQAREMSDSGVVEIQSHTYDLHNVGGLSLGTRQRVGYGVQRMRTETLEAYSKRLNADLRQSIEDIEAHVGNAPQALAYPFGAYRNDTKAITHQLFKGTFTITPGVRAFSSEQDLYEIPRILVRDNTSVLAEIRKYMVDDNLPWMQGVVQLLGLLGIGEALWFLTNDIRKSRFLNGSEQ